MTDQKKHLLCPNCDEKVIFGKHCSNCGASLVTANQAEYDPDFEDRLADKVADRIIKKQAKGKEPNNNDSQDPKSPAKPTAKPGIHIIDDTND